MIKPKYLYICLALLIFGTGNIYGTTKLRINHVTVAVKNLPTAVKDYQKAGFMVIETGQFGKKFVQNAHIPFLSKNYMELFAPVSPKTWPEFHALKKQGKLDTILKSQNIFNQRYLKHLATTEGLVDFAVSVQTPYKLQDILLVLTKSPLNYVGPIKMKRIQPNGVVVKWVVYVPNTNALPFLIQWQNEQAPPANVAAQAKLKITGISNISVAVKNFKQRVQQYKKLLGVAPQYIKSGCMPNTDCALFQLSHESINVMAPKNATSPISKYIQDHGVGPYSLTLQTKNKTTAKLDPALTHGANLILLGEKNKN